MDLKEGSNKRRLEEGESESPWVTPNQYKKPHSGSEGAQGISTSNSFDFMSDTGDEDMNPDDPSDDERDSVVD